MFAIQVESDLFIAIKKAQNSEPSIQVSVYKVRYGHQSEFQVIDGVLFVNNRIVVPDVSELRRRILLEAHFSRFSVYPGGQKIYNDLKSQSSIN